MGAIRPTDHMYEQKAGIFVSAPKMLIVVRAEGTRSPLVAFIACLLLLITSIRNIFHHVSFVMRAARRRSQC